LSIEVGRRRRQSTATIEARNLSNVQCGSFVRPRVVYFAREVYSRAICG